MHAALGFPESVLDELVADGTIDPSWSTVVVCGGTRDRDLLEGRGFRDVVITNVDDTPTEGIEPYRWEHQDAEQLSYPDDTFDVGVVVAGLHHCRSPHRALLELMRVTRRVVVAFEARDSAAMRLVCRLDLSEEYEISAVADQGLAAGGVANSPIPNYIYRWTEREVRKTVASYDAEHPPQVRFFGHLELPGGIRVARHGRGPRALLLRAVLALAPYAARAAPSQRNHLAIVIEHGAGGAQLHPWLRDDAGAVVPDAEHIATRYPIRDTGARAARCDEGAARADQQRGPATLPYPGRS